MTFVAIVVVGYLLGSCPWGYWAVRFFKKEDIRRLGSGNIGASNVWRTYGASLGVPVILADVAKGFLPTLAGVVFHSYVAGIAAGAAAMAGHWRPLFLGFARGGKMIATGCGVFFALAPLAGVAALALWAVVFFLSGYASLASLAAALFIPIGAYLFGSPDSVTAFGFVTFVVVVYLHRPNLKRLVHGDEIRSRIALIPRLRRVGP